MQFLARVFSSALLASFLFQTILAQCANPDPNGAGQSAIIDRYVGYIRNGKLDLDPVCAEKVKGKSAIVVGAGASGLIATRMFEGIGMTAKILEASDRVGGRIQTYRDTEQEWWAELGPMRLPEHHKLVLELCRMFNIKLQPFFETTIDLTAHPTANMAPFIKPFIDYQCMPWKEFVKKYDGYSMMTWLGKENEIKQLGDLYNANIIEVAASKSLSQPGNALYAVSKGFDQIPRKLAETLHSEIDYFSKVRHIHQNESGVEVKFGCRGIHCPATNTYEADYAIVTTPAPMTTGIRFDPPLPIDQQDSIRLIRYMNAVKVLVAFNGQWWQDLAPQTLKGSFDTNTHVRHLWIPPAQPDSGIGVLLVDYVYKMDAQRYTGMSDEEIIYELIQDLAHLAKVDYLTMKGRMVSHRIQRWVMDEYALGGFAFLGQGEYSQYQDLVGKPHGRVKFAGEHTEYPHGWIQTAMKSGIRAVEQIVEDICAE